METRDVGRTVTCYEALQVQPTAPLELITAAYWRLAGQTQVRRAVDPAAEAELHHLMLAYLMLTNPRYRAEYDASIGVEPEVFTPAREPEKQGLFRRQKQEEIVDEWFDYYEMLRIIPSAEPSIVAEAYSALIPYYGRLVKNGYSDQDLLGRLEEAYAAISDPERRRQYDLERALRLERLTSEPAEAVAAASAARLVAASHDRQLLDGHAVESNGSASKRGAGARAAGALGAVRSQLTWPSKRSTSGEQVLTERLQEITHHQVPETEEAWLNRLGSSVGESAAARESAPDGAPIAKLTLVESNGTPAEAFDLRHFPLTIGAGEGCDITLPGLADCHARLLHRDGRFVAFHLMGPEPADAEDADAVQLMENGDHLVLGPYRLIFSVETDASHMSSKSIWSPT
jgi:curved DNA-binding protein CbpA